MKSMQRSHVDPQPSRRHFLRGAGVALALPWMESLPLQGAQAAAKAIKQAAGAICVHLLLQRRRADSLVGQGQRRGDGDRSRLWRRCSRIREDIVVPARAVQRAGRAPQVRTWAASRTCSPARWVSTDQNEIRVGTHDGPGAGRADRQADGRAEPGARHRADRAAAGGRPVDDLRLVHLVDHRRTSRDQGNLSRAGVRSARRRRQRAAARPQHSRRRYSTTHDAAGRKSAQATATSSTSTSNRSATSSSGSSGAAKDGPPGRLAADARPSRTCRARTTTCRRTCPST